MPNKELNDRDWQLIMYQEMKEEKCTKSKCTTTTALICINWKIK
jgi:hypothetical protein